MTKPIENHKRKFPKKFPAGVFMGNTPGTFRARISINKQLINLGTFNSPEQAHEAYLIAKKQVQIKEEVIKPEPSAIHNLIRTLKRNELYGTPWAGLLV